MIAVDKAAVGRRIRALRAACGLTQEGLAVRLHVTGQAVSKWENGAALPDTAILPALAAVLRTSVDAILTASTPNGPGPSAGGDTIHRLPGFTWLPGSMLMGGCVKSCLRYVGVSVSDAWVSGAYAFILNISRDVTMRGPESWPDAGAVDRLTEDYGGVHERIEAARTDPTFRALQATAWAKARSAIDKGLPCFAWELAEPFWYIITGYDDVGYYYAGPGCEAGAGPKPWNELGDSDWGFLELHIIRPGHIADSLKTVRDVFTLAGEHAGRRSAGPADDVTGLAGYDRWIGAVESGTGDDHGLAYNAEFYARARQFAVDFLAEADQRIGGLFPSQFAAADAAYRTVRDNLAAVAALFPLPGDPSWRADSARRQAAARHLRAAKEAETAGLAAIASILAEIDQIW